MATLEEVLVAAEVGEKVDREGMIGTRRIESSARDHPEADAVPADLNGSI